MAGAFVGIRYCKNSWILGLQGADVLRGVSTDKGYEAKLMLTWSMPGVSQKEIKTNKFKEYNLEATVIQTSPRGRFVKIDQGFGSDIEKGMRFDIYKADFFGENILVASGAVFEVGVDWAIIKVTEKFQKLEIKNGFVARGY